MYEIQSNIVFLFDFLFIFLFFCALYAIIHLKFKKLTQDISRDTQVSDAGLSTLIYDLDSRIGQLSEDVQDYHEINRECLRLMVCELRQKQYHKEGWSPSRNKENMLEVAIEENKTKKRRPGRPPRTHIKSE